STHNAATTSRTHAYGSRTMHGLVLLLLPGEAPASGCISCQGDGRDQATYWLLMWLRTCALANFVSFDTTIFFDVYAPHLLRTQREQKSRIFSVGALSHTLDKAILRQKGRRALRSLACSITPLAHLQNEACLHTSAVHAIIRSSGTGASLFSFALGRLL
ncbi:unnamed protein product, partial [Ectocarpus sp. 6 AP-2014]